MVKSVVRIWFWPFPVPPCSDRLRTHHFLVFNRFSKCWFTYIILVFFFSGPGSRTAIVDPGLYRLPFVHSSLVRNCAMCVCCGWLSIKLFGHYYRSISFAGCGAMLLNSHPVCCDQIDNEMLERPTFTMNI